MASAAITINEYPATIETDSSEAVITKDLALMEGDLVNAGTVNTWLKISVTSTAAASVATTNAQCQLMVPLPAGCNCPILKGYKSIAHKTAGAAGVLAWFPARGATR
jgi:hypothetical protein